MYIKKKAIFKVVLVLSFIFMFSCGCNNQTPYVSQIECPELGNRISWIGTNTFHSIGLPAQAKEQGMTGTLIWSDQSMLSLDNKFFAVQSPNQFTLRLTPLAQQIGLAHLPAAGPVQLVVQVGTEWQAATLDSCLLTLPVVFPPTPSFSKSYQNIDVDNSLTIQYGGQSDGDGVLYVQELKGKTKVINRYLSKNKNKEMPYLEEDDSWVRIRDSLLYAHSTQHAVSQRGEILYSGLSPGSFDLSTVIVPEAISHQMWGISVKGIPGDSHSLVAAADLQRFLLVGKDAVDGFIFDGQDLVPSKPTDSTLLNQGYSIYGVALRPTAPNTRLPNKSEGARAEAVLWSHFDLEILEYDLGQYQSASAELSRSASEQLSALVDDFAKVKLVFVDLDEDGLLDLVAYIPNKEDIFWSPQLQTGAFGSFVPTGVTSKTPVISLTAGDLDGNGLADIAMMTYDFQAKKAIATIFFREL